MQLARGAGRKASGDGSVRHRGILRKSAATASVESQPMKNSRLLLGILSLVLSFAVHAAGPERVRVTTSLGSFVVELQRDRAPLTVENFLGYVKAGHYTNTLFHRTIANFIIQGGGVTPDYKAVPVLKPIANESGNGLKNLRDRKSVV